MQVSCWCCICLFCLLCAAMYLCCVLAAKLLTLQSWPSTVECIESVVTSVFLTSAAVLSMICSSNILQQNFRGFHMKLYWIINNLINIYCWSFSCRFVCILYTKTWGSLDRIVSCYNIAVLIVDKLLADVIFRSIQTWNLFTFVLLLISKRCNHLVWWLDVFLQVTLLLWGLRMKTAYFCALELLVRQHEGHLASKEPAVATLKRPNVK